MRFVTTGFGGAIDPLNPVSPQRRSPNREPRTQAPRCARCSHRPASRRKRPRTAPLTSRFPVLLGAARPTHWKESPCRRHPEPPEKVRRQCVRIAVDVRAARRTRSRENRSAQVDAGGAPDRRPVEWALASRFCARSIFARSARSSRRDRAASFRSARRVRLACTFSTRPSLIARRKLLMGQKKFKKFVTKMTLIAGQTG
jgi:hypothetical protein